MVFGVFHDLGFLHLYGLSDFRRIPVTSFRSLVKRVCRLHPNSDWAETKGMENCDNFVGNLISV